jgi:hypothetical protein
LGGGVGGGQEKGRAAGVSVKHCHKIYVIRGNLR